MRTLSDDELDAIATGAAHATPGTDDPAVWKVAYTAARAGAANAIVWANKEEGKNATKTGD